MQSIYKLSLVLCAFLLSCPQVLAQHQLASPGHAQPRARHRRNANIYNTSITEGLHRRDDNVGFTWFVDGLGACGATNSASDWIVALNSGEYDGGAHCFQTVTIVINGITAQAQITDECPTCDYGGLDLSQGLFQHFAPTSVGELYGNWYYGSASPTPTPPPPTTTSSTPAWTPPPTTSSTSSSVYSATTSTPTSTSSSATSTSSPSSGLSPVPTFTPQDPQILVQINVGLLEFGSLLQASLSF